MRAVFVTVLVGSMLAALPALADNTNGARPDNPSGFGQAAATDAHSATGFVGDLATDLAHNGYGNGAGTEVHMFHEMNGSTPNPTDKNH
jgi:hypothetical protein